MSDPFDPQTLRFYADHAAAYLASRPATPSRHLELFLEQLPPGALILELGCGHGIDAETMRARGFRVDPTDGVPEMAAAASARLGTPVRVMRFEQMHAHGVYDAVWANASLHHVPLAELPDFLRRIFASLKPGGFHFANFKSGDAEGRDEKGRFYNCPKLDVLVETYKAAAPWEILAAECHVRNDASPAERGTWVSVTVRRPMLRSPPA